MNLHPNHLVLHMYIWIVSENQVVPWICFNQSSCIDLFEPCQHNIFNFYIHKFCIPLAFVCHNVDRHNSRNIFKHNVFIDLIYNRLLRLRGSSFCNLMISFFPQLSYQFIFFSSKLEPSLQWNNTSLVCTLMYT
jgi:hypothetical protein